MHATLTYTEAYDRITAFANNMPTHDKTTDVFTANGGWDLVYYDSMAALATGTVQFCHYGTNLNGANNALTITATAGKSNIGYVDAAFNAHWGPDSYWGNASNGNLPDYALAIKGSKIAGYRYTVEVAGLLNIDFTNLGRFGKPQIDSASDISYAIYVDGQKVWPSSTSADNASINAAGWYKLGALEKGQQKIVTAEANATDVAARRNIYVHKGSQVEILCTNTGTSIYSGAGQLMHADIKITEMDPKLTMFGTVGEAFAMNLVVGDTTFYSDIAVLLNGKSIDGNKGVYTLTDIAAKELDDSITYEVTGKVNGRTVTIA